MIKTYTDFMDEITAEELYQGLLVHGLFSEKLPPIFDATDFFNYQPKQPFSKNPHGYVYYEAMRDINIPRTLGIPNPMAYQLLCQTLSDKWDEIRRHFREQTNKNNHKISRIHIRKRKETQSLFKMNYSNWRVDASPIPDIQIGMKYVVHADISTCFPSMYTHALPWALVGKEVAKDTRSANEWYNELDCRCRNLRDGETHGFLIGPHASNLLAEIILTVVDNRLSSAGWKFIRNIDDYDCYVKSYDDGQRFLAALGAELRYFDLPLNHKKTRIEELPMASTSHWVRQINAVEYLASYGEVNYKTAQAYIDAAIALMNDNGQNAAILNYAIKVLARQKTSDNAKALCLKTFMHLALIYPYLIPLLDEYVFDPYEAKPSDIKKYTQFIFESGVERNNFEAVSYAIYFALKYDFQIAHITTDIVKGESSVTDLLVLLYFRKYGNDKDIKTIKKCARNLVKDESDFDRNWLFVYEALSYNDLKGEWKPMKNQGVSFVKAEFR